jgi:hypothetical protein
MEFSKYVIENETNHITKQDMLLIFEKYLKPRNLEIEPTELFQKMLDRCDIVALDLDTIALRFKHRTFAEFLYAKYLSKNKGIDVNEKAFDLYWANIYFFFLGIKKDDPETLNMLVNLHPEKESRRWLKMINMANFYLAAYTSPYNIVATGISQIYLEAACLFKDTISNKIKPPIPNISHMGLLYIVQLLVRESYSYVFFKNAIEDAALLINESKEYDIETKAYAIFFLNVTYIDLKGTDSFDFLLQDYLKQLPIDLSLAVDHESKGLTRTRLMKKQDRHVKFITSDNRSLKSQIEVMYHNPLTKKLITK